jgi:hypothetical protein
MVNLEGRLRRSKREHIAQDDMEKACRTLRGADPKRTASTETAW